MTRTRISRRPALPHLFLVVGTTLVAGATSLSCSPGKLDRRSAKALIDDHIGASLPLALVDIPLDFLLSTQPRLTAGSDADVALEIRLPDGTPPLRRVTDCTVRLLPDGSRFFSSILTVNNLGGGDFLRLALRDPVERTVVDVTGMVEHPMSASVCQVEYTWTYPLAEDLAAIRCRVVLTSPSAGPLGPPPPNAPVERTFDVLWSHPESPLQAGRATVSRYDDGWRVTR